MYENNASIALTHHHQTSDEAGPIANFLFEHSDDLKMILPPECSDSMAYILFQY